MSTTRFSREAAISVSPKTLLVVARPSASPVDYPAALGLDRNDWDLTTAKPGVAGPLTNNCVYDRLAPGARAELNRLTPRDDQGRLKNTLFQRLSEDLGHPSRIGSRAPALPRFGDTIPLPLEEARPVPTYRSTISSRSLPQTGHGA